MRGLASWFSLFTDVITSVELIQVDYECTELEFLQGDYEYTELEFLLVWVRIHRPGTSFLTQDSITNVVKEEMCGKSWASGTPTQWRKIESE